MLNTNQLAGGVVIRDPNGTPYDISISSDLPIPSGTLIHKFIYSDGSIRTINTIK